MTPVRQLLQTTSPLQSPSSSSWFPPSSSLFLSLLRLSCQGLTSRAVETGSVPLLIKTTVFKTYNYIFVSESWAVTPLLFVEIVKIFPSLILLNTFLKAYLFFLYTKFVFNIHLPLIIGYVFCTTVCMCLCVFVFVLYVKLDVCFYSLI